MKVFRQVARWKGSSCDEAAGLNVVRIQSGSDFSSRVPLTIFSQPCYDIMKHREGKNDPLNTLKGGHALNFCQRNNDLFTLMGIKWFKTRLNTFSAIHKDSYYIVVKSTEGELSMLFSSTKCNINDNVCFKNCVKWMHEYTKALNLYGCVICLSVCAPDELFGTLYRMPCL